MTPNSTSRISIFASPATHPSCITDPDLLDIANAEQYYLLSPQEDDTGSHWFQRSQNLLTFELPAVLTKQQ
jgi:hypothetical protein